MSLFRDAALIKCNEKQLLENQHVGIVFCKEFQIFPSSNKTKMEIRNYRNEIRTPFLQYPFSYNTHFLIIAFSTNQAPEGVVCAYAQQGPWMWREGQTWPPVSAICCSGKAVCGTKVPPHPQQPAQWGEVLGDPQRSAQWGVLGDLSSGLWWQNVEALHCHSISWNGLPVLGTFHECMCASAGHRGMSAKN